MRIGIEDADRPSHRGGAAPAQVTIRTTARALAFTAPPVSIRLKFVIFTRFWSIFVQPLERLERPGMASVLEWIDTWRPLRIEFGSRRVLRADFDPLPAAWLQHFHAVDVEELILYADDTAIATVRGPHAALAAFARTLTADTHADVREVREAPRDVPLLTAAQDAALRGAVEAGYYQIPRPLNLHQLAEKLGVSSASLSERLRRAEARVILRYVREGNVTPWDLHTIFNAHHPVTDGIRDYAIYTLDPSGTVMSWNAGARLIIGYEPREIVGKHFSRLFTEADRARGRPQEGLRVALEQGSYEENGWRVRKGGSQFLANVVATPIIDAEGGLVGFSNVTRDLGRKVAADAAEEQGALLSPT